MNFSVATHATSLNSLRRLARPVESASYSILYFRIAVHRFGGWDLRATQVANLLSLACRASWFSSLMLFSSDPPCKIEDVPAVDAIVLSVSLVYSFIL